MELSGNFFEYNGISSRLYGLIFANAETDRYVSLAGEVKTKTIFNKKNKRNYYIGEEYADSPIQFDAEIVVANDGSLDRFQRMEIERWLFHQPGYRKLYIDNECDFEAETSEFVNGEQKRLYLNCRFVNPDKIEGNGGIAGYRFVVECDSCMAWQDEVVYEYELPNNLSTSSSTIYIDVNSDLEDYVYPKVTIQTGSVGGNIQIINNTDNTTRPTSFVDLPANAVITMKGDGVNYISGEYYLKFSNKNFIRLLNGENVIIVTGNVTKLEFEFQNRRYM